VKRVENVIDTSSDFGAQAAAFELVKKLSAQSTHGKKVFILTSGSFVQGFDHPGLVTAEEQTSNPPAFLATRAKLETEVITTKEVHGIVIRPGFCYGYSGGNGGMHIGDNVFQLQDGKIQISGSLEKRWSWIHVDDLARAYLLAMQKFTIASGQIFNVATRGSNPTYLEYRKRAAEVAGHKNAEIVQIPVPEQNHFAILLENSQVISPKKQKIYSDGVLHMKHFWKICLMCMLHMQHSKIKKID